MTIDLKILVWSVLLTVLQVVVAVLLGTSQVGFSALMGNREHLPTFEGAAGRAHRAHKNMLESLILFAALVLTAHASGRADATTALGAQLFFWGRVVYAGLYIAGITWVRTLAWSVALLGMLMIAWRLL